MARILIFGGHGKVARLLEPLLAQRGDAVTAVIRSADQRGAVEATGATPVIADIEDLDVGGFADLMGAIDTVVWSAGAGGGSEERTYAIDRDAAIRCIDAAVQSGVERFVMVSYFGASATHHVPIDDPFFAYAEAKAAADAHLRASSVKWTVVAPSSLTADVPTGRIDASATEPASVSRGDVAAVIAAALLDEATVGRTIAFNSGTTPIAAAISAPAPA